MAVSFTQWRRPLPAVALLAAVAGAAGCGGASPRGTQPSIPAAGAAQGTPSTFRNDFLALRYPAGWKAFRFPAGQALHFQPMVYLSAQPAHDPCRRAGTTTTCGWPVRKLLPDSALVVWENRGAPGWSLSAAQGTRVRVGGRPAVRQVERPGACAAIGADETVSVVIQRPLRYNWTSFTACLRGPDLARPRHEVAAILRSTRFLTP